MLGVLPFGVFFIRGPLALRVATKGFCQPQGGKGQVDTLSGLYRDYRVYTYILGLYRENGKENGNYYLGFRV